MTETKHEKFLRLKGARLEKAVYHIGLLSNLASSNYEYTEAEAEKLTTDLQTAVDAVAEAFSIKRQEPEPEPEPEPERDNARPTETYDRGWVAWAYETLRRGDKAEAEKMLQIALKEGRKA